MLLMAGEGRGPNRATASGAAWCALSEPPEPRSQARGHFHPGTLDGAAAADWVRGGAMSPLGELMLLTAVFRLVLAADRCAEWV